MIVELNRAFKNYKFTESNHTYVNTTTGEELISVTGLLKKLKPDFDSNYWATYTALKRNGFKVQPIYPDNVKIEGITYNIEPAKLLVVSPTVEDIKDEWSIAALNGQSLGTFLHNTMENNMMRKSIDLNIPKYVLNLDSLETIKYLKHRDILKNMSDAFYTDFIERYTPITTEYVLGDSELNIAGTFDLLAVDNETNEVVLWDYKTDKQIRSKSEYGNKINVFNIDDCELNKYSLQMSIYKYLIEKNTGIKISCCKIAHFDYRYENISVMTATNYDDAVKEFFKNDDNKSIYFGYKTINKRKRTRR